MSAWSESPPEASRAGDAGTFEILGHAGWSVRLAWSVAPRLVAARIGFAILNGAIPAVFVYGAREIIDDLQTSSTLAEALPWIVIVPVLSFIAVLLRPFTALVSDRLADELEIETGYRILDHAARLQLPFFEDVENQDVLSRVQGKSARHMQSLIDGLAGLARNAVQLVTLLLVVLIIEPVVVLLLAVLAVPYLVYQARLSKTHYALEYNREGRRRWTNYFTGKLVDHDAVPEVKLYGLAPHLIDRFRGIMRRIRDENRSIYLRRAIGGFVFGVVGAVIIYAAVLELAQEALAGETTVGSVAAYLLAIERLAATVTDVVNLAARSIHSTLMVTNLREFFATEPSEPERATRPGGRDGGEGAIEFRSVSFRYPGSSEDAVRDVSFRVEPGEIVALVGSNGAGKSTIVKLLGGLYRPDRGTIALDGRDLADLDVAEARARMSFVLQGFNRYEATAGENIAYGEWQRLLDDPEEVRRIAERAGVSDVIERLPEGYDTHLGRMFGEVTLSGGHWQVLAMARALARDSDVLVFDEPTSNLDASREYEIFRRLRDAARDRTVILVSHRFSTVRMAERILVMEGGTLVEQGTHEELVEKNQVYARLYELHAWMYAGGEMPGSTVATNP
ncbi:MAG: ABC transporter ATP-binding protein [Gemmatimonadota bacterium]|nr:ABC transporter ATP-binding protein [Gemmatimonadota bacterium]